MNKKILPLLTSLALTVTLVGCNPSNNNDDGEFGEDEVAEELTLPTNVTYYTLDETDYDSLSEQATGPPLHGTALSCNICSVSLRYDLIVCV